MDKPPHILLIDDDPLIRRLFGSKLASSGFEVLYAGNGNDGREMARRFQPNLIILDMRMPGMDGMEVAQRLKDEKETKHIPIVLLTSNDLSPESEQMMKEAWIADYIQKGIELNEFIERVKKIIN
ncbi:MAG TPA: response regulator, partial [Patescibacteria group bacterium]|nr:response regulator [Patescibacteria group bacterium]